MRFPTDASVLGDAGSAAGEMCIRDRCIVASVALLAGLTFAWFTDTATSKDNRIQAGTLKVELLKDGQPVAADAPIFAADKWEPGFSAGAGLAVKLSLIHI